MNKALLVFSAVLIGCVIAYLIYFLRGWIKAHRLGSKERPSFIGLAVFITSIFIFWVIVIPNFRRFAAHDKQAEAKTNLGAIYVAQLSYFSNANTYASGPDAFKLLQWEPFDQNRYAFYCQGVMIPGKPPKRWQFWLIRNYPRPSDSNWPVSLKPQSSKTGFTCMAVGNIDNDETLDVWSISDGKILRNDLNDLNNKSWTYDFR